MTARFGVLGSGSAGNASYLEADGFGLLIDAGLGPRRIERALAEAGISWNEIGAVLLTHTHGDHCRHATLKHLARRQIPLYCHVRHQAALHGWTTAIATLEDVDLVRNYELNQPTQLGPIEVRPFAVPHDDTLTCGFRFEGAGWSLGYAADLGSWTREIVAQLLDVEVLALEFNHDVAMQKASGRTPWLIARNLGARGHLSNVQAAALLQAVLRQSARGRLRHLVQLHLSEQCNTPDLARTAAEQAAGALTAIHTADAACLPWLTFGRETAPLRAVKLVQAFLPGWEEELAG
jgi:phosphoribosyl 1,2-cyclic phosphodiesterase